MTRSEQGRLGRLFQKAADCVCINAPDRIHIRIEEERLRLAFTTWSPALTRQSYEQRIELADIDEYLVFPEELTTWEDCALPLMKSLLDRNPATQVARHECAQRLGLVRGGKCSSLDPVRLAVDRSILRMLDIAGIDVRSAVASVSDNRRIPSDVLKLEHLRLELQRPSISIVQFGTCVPEVRTNLPLGRGWYGGDRLTFDTDLPATIAIASIGRRLGDVVATGDPVIDDRRITGLVGEPEAVIEDGELRRFTRTSITLEPDLVEVGGHPVVDLFSR